MERYFQPPSAMINTMSADSRPYRTRRLSQTGVHDGAGGKPRKDAFAIQQLPNPAD